MNGKTCFFIGNRNTPSSIEQQLIEVVEQHITQYGVTIFTVGHYGSFDSLVTRVLKKTKKQYPHIELYLLAPYALNQNRETPEGFNSTFYPEGLETVPKAFAIVQANRYMIQNSDYLITYCHNIGNTRNFVKYAQRREKKGLIKITSL
ncbi:hypothetical protein IJE86_00790 [bacterium]|nr:hypothetical protein [bacterium]